MENLLDRCVFLFGRQRSGTTVLRRAWASHPMVKDLGEIMHPEFQQGFYSHLHQALSDQKENATHSKWFQILMDCIERQAHGDSADMRYVIDIKYNMAHAFGIEFNGVQPVNALLNTLRMQNAKVIHLVRKNKLGLMVSERVAMKTNQWEFSGASEAKKKNADVHVSPITLGLKLRQEMAQDEYFSHQTDFVSQKLPLVYEEMFSDEGEFEEHVFSGFSELMDVSQAEFKTTPLLKKQRRELSETISNFADVRRAVQILIKEGEIPSYFSEGMD